MVTFKSNRLLDDKNCKKCRENKLGIHFIWLKCLLLNYAYIFHKKINGYFQKVTGYFFGNWLILLHNIKNKFLIKNLTYFLNFQKIS